jgi:uncharacterized protein
MKNIYTKLFEKVTSKVKLSVKEFDPNAEVILFGSRARGDYKKDSDWDFLILTPKKLNENIKKEFRSKLLLSEIETNQCFFSLVENYSDWESIEVTEIYKNVQSEGIKL